MGVTVLEDVSVKLARTLSVFDASSLTESVGRNLICNIKPTTTAGTFGETTKLGSEASSQNRQSLIKYQSGSAGTLASISLYVKLGSGLANVKCAIFDSSFNLLANGITEEKISTTGQDGWIVFDFSTPPTVSATTDYYLAFWAGPTQSILFYYAAGGVNQYQREDKTYDTWNDPVVPDGGGNYKMSVFATYVEAATGPLESISLSEAVLMTGVSTVNVYDSAAATDVDAVQLLTLFNFAVSDSVSLTESVATPKLSYRPSVYDSVSVAELVSSIVELADVDVYDSVTVAEDIVLNLVSLISTYDSVALAELVSGVAEIAGISIYEAISVLEKIYLSWWLGIVKDPTTWSDVAVEDTEWSDITKDDTEWSDVR